MPSECKKPSLDDNLIIHPEQASLNATGHRSLHQGVVRSYRGCQERRRLIAYPASTLPLLSGS